MVGFHGLGDLFQPKLFYDSKKGMLAGLPVHSGDGNPFQSTLMFPYGIMIFVLLNLNIKSIVIHQSFNLCSYS